MKNQTEYISVIRLINTPINSKISLKKNFILLLCVCFPFFSFVGLNQELDLPPCSEEEKVKFFNDEAYTTTLPAQLALKYNLKIFPIFIERQNDDFFNIEVYDAILPHNYNNKIEISKKLNEVLEKMILRNPNQWIWTHDRWK